MTFIDTAANYGDGDSELAIGHVLQDLIYNHDVNRDDLVLMSSGLFK